MATPTDFLTELRLFWVCTPPVLCKPTPLVQEKATRWLGWLPKACHTETAMGFTLAELLIALAILGVIATFTIPKIITGQQTSVKNAAAHEVAGMIAGAFQKAQMDGVITSTSKSSDILPYINYVSLDTSGTVIDAHPGVASSTCNASTPCALLHNGGYLWFQDSANFGGNTTLNTVAYRFDPDPINNTTSTADGPLKAIGFNLYYNNLLRTRGYTLNGSCDISGCTGKGPNSAFDPSWFSW